jgi:hypothetical protein
MNLTSDYTRVAVELEDRGDPDPLGDKSYFSIGHGSWQDSNSPDLYKYALWYYVDGNLIVDGPHEVSKGLGPMDTQMHRISDVIPGWGVYDEVNIYRGRADLTTNQISVIKPYRQRHRPIPSSLQNLLLNKFPHTTKIVTFE